jgi:hypothetical protein
MPADLGFCLLGASGPITLPLPAFLIEHDHGLVLFDTGLAPEAWDEGPRAVYGAVADMFPFECPPDNRLDLQISKAGFRVEDITHVVVSHAHLDHTGGLFLFLNAQFYISEQEMAYAFWPHPFFQEMFGRKDLERVRSCHWNLLSADLDLFGEGSIQILRTPGHTPGQMSMLVKLESRSFLLTRGCRSLANQHRRRSAVPSRPGHHLGVPVDPADPAGQREPQGRYMGHARPQRLGEIRHRAAAIQVTASSAAIRLGAIGDGPRAMASYQ